MYVLDIHINLLIKWLLSFHIKPSRPKGDLFLISACLPG